MTDFIYTKQQSEQLLLSSFFKMVQTYDGDFTVIEQLVKASSDSESLQLGVERLKRHPKVKKAFENPFSLGVIDLEKLRQLPGDTLGRLYAEHIIENQLKPAQPQPIAESDQQFLVNHTSETHDIWHVVTGCKTDILGEIQLEAFYVAQLEVTRFWLALLAKNLLKSALYDLEISTQYMESLTEGWTLGKKAEPLFGIDWNTLWTIPIDQVRTSLNIYL